MIFRMKKCISFKIAISILKQLTIPFRVPSCGNWYDGFPPGVSGLIFPASGLIIPAMKQFRMTISILRFTNTWAYIRYTCTSHIVFYDIQTLGTGKEFVLLWKSLIISYFMEWWLNLTLYQMVLHTYHSLSIAHQRVKIN